MSADLSEYGVPKGGYVISFRKALQKGFSEMLGWGGQETIFLRKLPVIVHTWVRNSLFCCRAGCTDCTCMSVHAEFRKNVVS